MPRAITAGLPLGRWAALLALLLAEGLTLSVFFDSDALDRLPGGPLTFLVRHAGDAARTAPVVLACLVLVAAARARRSAGSSLAHELAGHRFVPLALAHLASFGALAGLTFALYGGSAPPLHAEVLVGAWLVALLLTLATWLLTLVPPRLVPALAREHGGLLAASLGLGLVAFGVGKLADQLWLPLRRVTFALSSYGLGLFVRDPVSDPATFALGTEDFIVEIAPQCSGYEGVGLSLVFLSATLWFFRDRLRFPRALWLLPIGAAASFLANIARLVALVLVGSYISPQIGAGGFHSYAGTLLFCALGLSMVALALRSPWLAREGGAEAPTGAHPATPAAPYLVPFLAVVAAGLVVGAFSGAGREPLYAVKPVLALAALAVYWPVYRGFAWRETWRVSWFAPLVGALVAALWLVLGAAFPSTASSAPPPASLAGVLRALTTVLVVPLIEELAFRGFLARRLSTPAFDALPPQRVSALGVVLSSLAFGLLHARPVAGGLAGLGYALAYRARGRLGDAVVAHAATNAILVVASAWLGDAAGP